MVGSASLSLNAPDGVPDENEVVSYFYDTARRLQRVNYQDPTVANNDEDISTVTLMDIFGRPLEARLGVGARRTRHNMRNKGADCPSGT